MLFTSDKDTDIKSGFNKLEKRLKKIDNNLATSIDNNKTIEEKIDVLVEIFKADDKIILDEYKLDLLLYHLNNYFENSFRETECNRDELPLMEFEAYSELIQFNEYYKKVKKQNIKRKTCKCFSNRRTC